jgi:hypothetical protein
MYMSEEFDALKKENFMKLMEAAANGESSPDIKFDMWAQDPHDWNWLQEMIPGVVITSAGGIMPFQVEGYLNDHPFYYKERDGDARLNVGAVDGPAPYLGDCIYTSKTDVEEFRRGPGWISTFMNLIEALARSHFLYEFEGKKVIMPNNESDKNLDNITVAEGITEIYKTWGHSPEEALAYHYTSGKGVLVDHYGWQLEYYDKMIELEDINPIPLNKDERVIPEPVFEVRAPEIWRNSEGLVEIPENVWVAK